MSTPKHTPGPWVAIKGDTFNPERPWGVSKYLSREAHIEIDGDDKEYPCRTEVIAELTETDNPQEVEHTAYLIAAAPAMYEALRELYVYAYSQQLEWECNNPEKEYNPLRLKLITEARAALAQAEGKL